MVNMRTLLFIKLGFCGKIACTPCKGNVLPLPFGQYVIFSVHQYVFMMHL